MLKKEEKLNPYPQICRTPPELLQPVEEVESDENFPRLGSIRGAYDSALLHEIHELCGPAVSDAESALEE